MYATHNRVEDLDTSCYAGRCVNDRGAKGRQDLLLLTRVRVQGCI